MKKIFTGLLTDLVNGSNYTKCVSLINQKCMTQATLMNLHPNDYNQEFHYHPFAVNLDRCIFLTSTYTRFKSKIHNHQVRQMFRTWDLNWREFVKGN